MDKHEEDSTCPVYQSHCAFGSRTCKQDTEDRYWENILERKGKRDISVRPVGPVEVSSCKGGPKYYGRPEHKWSVPSDF